MPDRCNAVPHCQYDKLAWTCRSRSVARSCALIAKNSTCMATAGCAWSAAARLCHETGAVCENVKRAASQLSQHIPCSHVRGRPACKAAGCTFWNNLCLDSDGATSCSAYSRPSQCLRVGCDWQAGACSPVSSSALSVEPEAAARPAKEVWQTIPINIGHQRASVKRQRVHESWLCDKVECVAPTCPAGETPAIHSQECCARCSASDAFCRHFQTEVLLCVQSLTLSRGAEHVSRHLRVPCVCPVLHCAGSAAAVSAAGDAGRV